MSEPATVIADSDRMLSATIVGTGDRTELIVTRSLLLNVDVHSAYRPVADLLGSQCTKTIDKFEFAVDNMYSGQAELARYRVFSVCPGSSVPHTCRKVKSGRSIAA